MYNLKGDESRKQSTKLKTKDYYVIVTLLAHHWIS